GGCEVPWHPVDPAVPQRQRRSGDLGLDCIYPARVSLPHSQKPQCHKAPRKM
ncbi:hypothetical protein GGI05_001241, partial [Coemansia sp. RSA 2603]